MNRSILLGAALAALALPGAAGAGASAGASVNAASAAKGEPFSVRFTVVSEGGKPVIVKRFRFYNLPITCDQGDFLLNSRIGGQIPVEDKHFAATATHDDPPSEARLTGRFVSPGKVKGRVKATGTYAGPSGDVTNCTGSRRYTAT